MIEITNDIIGKQVMFTNKEAHERQPEYYPRYGTVGTVLDVFVHTVLVQWPEGETFGDGSWLCDREDVVVMNKRCVKCI